MAIAWAQGQAALQRHKLWLVWDTTQNLICCFWDKKGEFEDRGWELVWWEMNGWDCFGDEHGLFDARSCGHRGPELTGIVSYRSCRSRTSAARRRRRCPRRRPSPPRMATVWRCWSSWGFVSIDDEFLPLEKNGVFFFGGKNAIYGGKKGFLFLLFLINFFL